MTDDIPMIAGAEAGAEAGVEAGMEAGMTAGAEAGIEASPRQLCEESCAQCNFTCEEKVSTTFDGGYFISDALGKYFASRGMILDLSNCNGYRTCEESFVEYPPKRSDPDQSEK
jgi:hypothetical protein